MAFADNDCRPGQLVRRRLGGASRIIGNSVFLLAFGAPLAAYGASPVPLQSNNVAPLGSSPVPNAANPPSGVAQAATNMFVYPPGLQWQGLVVNLPPPANTIDGELGGARRTLADNGIAYFGYDSTTFFDNLLNHVHSIRGQQLYAGQRPTVLSDNFAALIFDLGHYGLKGGQIVVAGQYTSVSWNTLGPTSLSIGQLSYHQYLFNKRLEIEVGLQPLNTQFIGTFVGGSLNGGVFGPQASVLGENGLTTLSYATPTFEVTGHITDHFYDKTAVARAVTPDGTIDEHNYNPTGVSKFTTKDAGPLFLDELGYLRHAATGIPEMWIRGGAVNDRSRLPELDHPGKRSRNQYGLYLLGDRQLVQISSRPHQAYRGLYAGFSIEYAPQNYSIFTQYYEARVFGLGLLPTRPLDEVSVVFTDNVFSNTVVKEYRGLHVPAHSDSKAVTASYSYQVIPGLYGNLGVEYVNNPTPVIYTSNTGSALDIIAGISLYF